MRIFVAVFILIFSLQSWTKADDIRDFEIEGMSLYDSALDYFSLSEIEDSKRNFYINKKYTTSSLKSDKFQIYSEIQISYRSDDKSFKMLDINGIVKKNYEECMKEIETTSLEFDQIFKEATQDKLLTYSHNSDISKESKVSDIYWRFDNGDLIVLACYNWDTKYGKENNYNSEIRVTIGSKEFDAFLVEESKF